MAKHMYENVYFTYLVVWVLTTLSNSDATPIGESLQLDHREPVFKELFGRYEAEVGILNDKLATLAERVSKLESISALINDEPGGVEGINNSNHLIRKRATRRRIRRPEVAFQASLTKDSVRLELYDTIVFNNVITNIHNSYNRHTGVFTAPVSGTYTFNTNIVSGKGHYVEASIKVNDMVTVSAISDHRSPRGGDYFTTWDQGNAFAILRLNRGDKVSVTVQWPRGSHVIHGVGKTSFSGYLLRSHERR